MIVLLSVALFSLAAFYAYKSFDSLISSVNYLVNPGKKLDVLNKLVEDNATIDYNFRMYALTKDTTHLINYMSHSRRFEDRLKSLKTVLSKNKGEIKEADSIKVLWNNKNKDILEMIKLFNMEKVYEEIDIPAKITTADTVAKKETPVVTNFFKRLGRIFSKKKDSTASEPQRKIKKPIKGKEIVKDSVNTDSLVLKAIGDYKNKIDGYEKNLNKIGKEIFVNDFLIRENLHQMIENMRREEITQSSDAREEARRTVIKSFFQMLILGGVCLAISLLLIYLIYQDVSNSNRYRLELIQAKIDAEKAARSKEEFLLTISHELRTPLNAIVGFSEQMSNLDLNSKQKHYNDIVIKSSELLIQTVNEVLDYSKLEAGKFVLENNPFNVKEVVQEVIQLLLPKANEKNIGLQLKTEGVAFSNVCGDPYRLRQILINIVYNAIKFTELGEVKMEVFESEIGDGSKINLTFVVTDTGVGISQEKIDLLFQEFMQAESYTSRKFGGSGLGLVICKKLIEAQGGNIQMESRLGLGTKVLIEIPFEVSRVEAKKATLNTHNISPRLHLLKVLIAEDDELSVLLLHSIFSKYNIEADIASNGEEAYRKFEIGHYDVVITDMQMPLMNGVQLLEAVRNHFDRTKSQIPFLLLTANVQVIKHAVLQYDKTDTLLKPYKAHELLTKISALTNSGELEIPVPLMEKVDKPSFHEFAQGDKETEDEIMRVVIRSCEDYIAKLKRYPLMVSSREIEELTHKLIPVFIQLRAIHLSPHLNKLESVARHGQEAEIKELCEVIIKESTIVLENIKSGL
jgi:hypothetical protein